MAFHALDEEDDLDIVDVDDIPRIMEASKGERKADSGTLEDLFSDDLEPLLGAAAYYFMKKHDLTQQRDEEFIDKLADRFLGRKVGHDDEQKVLHLGDGERTSFEINAPLFMLAPGFLEILATVDSKSLDVAFAQDNRGDPAEPTFSEFEGERILTWGTWSTRISGVNVCIHVWEGNGDCDFTFTYLKKDHAKLMPIMTSIKEAIDSCRWFKGRSLAFDLGRLRIVEAPKTKMADVVMNAALKTDIFNNTTYYLQNLGALQKEGLYARRGILLSGPPGNGKTMSCRAIANEAPIGTTVIWITGGSVDTTSNITALFKLARALSPTILIFEDIDTLAGSRKATGVTYPLLGEMLTQMDGIGDTSGIIVVATTNYPEMVDSALRDRPRRFDRHYQINLPDRAGRVELLRRNLPVGLINEEDLNRLSGSMEDASAAIVEEIIHTARVDAIRKGETLNYSHLTSSLAEVKRHEALLSSSPELI